MLIDLIDLIVQNWLCFQTLFWLVSLVFPWLGYCRSNIRIFGSGSLWIFPPPKNTNISNGTSTTGFNRKYNFIHGGFSSASHVGFRGRAIWLPLAWVVHLPFVSNFEFRGWPGWFFKGPTRWFMLKNHDGWLNAAISGKFWTSLNHQTIRKHVNIHEIALLAAIMLQ